MGAFKKISFSSFHLILLPCTALILLGAGLARAPYALFGAVILGILKITVDSIKKIKEGQYSLDYVACAALAMSLYTHEYLAGAVIAFMFIGGETLEAYASERAHSALKTLSDTIPKKCVVLTKTSTIEKPIQHVLSGDLILIKNNEMVPLDGTLLSPQEALLTLSNLTGETGAINFKKGTLIKSGSINSGETLTLRVTGSFETSTYHKIVSLVDEAKAHPARIVRLSERANFYFTFFTFTIGLGALVATGDITRLLAVLVIATPCPLIIAAPVAFVSGMSKAARDGIILRKPAAFEGLDKVSTIFFDKTGTLTLGEPRLKEIELKSSLTEHEALSIAAGIEIHSLHPLGRALVQEARAKKISYTIATHAQETVGKGISGKINGKTYTIMRAKESTQGIALALVCNNKELAHFHFADMLKKGALSFLSELQTKKITTAIITGDKKKNAQAVFKGLPIKIYADQSPADKYALIKQTQLQGKKVVMIGDGLNDAPALALADVGVVFSGAENGASIEAADVAILGYGMEKLFKLFETAHHTVHIAKQSIYGGIALSVLGMCLAALGLLQPVTGALIQEGIDVVVILNALRALKKN